MTRFKIDGREDSTLALDRPCTDGSCGACLVLVDGVPELGCKLDPQRVLGRSIETADSSRKSALAERVEVRFLEDRPTRCQRCVAPLRVAALFVERTGAQVDGAIAPIRCVCTGRASLLRAFEP